ncbi:MAG TPA: hypothetical protein VF179_14950 [Thermoanaerobaculia bacterium]|nr:hypothetical protein [Thermoanaerobaculia bacterium]
MIKTYGRGSEWRRWDLHIHTPGTALNDQFGDWEEYLAAIEAADGSIAALGITDYFTIRTYKTLLVYRQKRHLPKIDLILPNIEFRLTPVTKGGKAINLHLLISPHDPNHVARIEEALNQLTIDRAEDRIPCTEEGLRRLGSRMRPELSNDPEAAFKEGVEQFKIGFDLFQRWWKSQPWLQQNSLVAVANSSFDGASGLQHDSGLRDTRDEIYRFSHIIFSGRPADRDFFLGTSTHGLHYGAPKPCLHGSDAHSIAALFRPAENRYCWIKADPTFEGLRQTLYEPEDRVWIGEEPPRHYDPDSVIDSITFRDTAGWFEERTLSLNSGLVTIVGLKGSGKTALADMLAFSTGSPVDPNESFLSRASEHLAGMGLDLKWASGHSDAATLPDSPPWTFGSGVRYLSQKFVERLCAGDQLSHELLQEIEDVIFTYIPSDERVGAADFRELREIRTGAIRQRRNELASLISQLSREIGELDRKRQEIRAKDARRKDLARSIENLQKSRPKADDQAVQAKLREVGEAKAGRDKLAEEIGELRRQKQNLEDLKRKIAVKFQEISSFWQGLQQALVLARFTPEEVGRLKPYLPDSWHDLFREKAESLDTQIAQRAGDHPTASPPPVGTVPTTLAAWNLLVGALEMGINLDSERKRQILESQKQEEKFAAELVRINNEFRWLDEVYPEERKHKTEERNTCYLEFFDLLAEEQGVLYELYEHLRASLARQGQHEQRLELFCRVEVDVKAWVERGEDLFDLRRQGPLREGFGDFARRHLEGAWRSCDKEAIETGIEALINLIREPEILRSQLKTNVTLLNVADWLFSVDHISITYGIRYDGKDLRLLSPGTKGIVLLILYLAVDTEDHRPLIVDQPDENLDNQSIFEILRGYFRDAKKRRQVIIITHNPNLVVNTDAEQIIIAQSYVRANGLPAMTYSLGSLEALAAEGLMKGSIRAEICRLLEGGRDAFRMRERRYGDLEALPVENIRLARYPSGYEPPKNTA